MGQRGGAVTPHYGAAGLLLCTVKSLPGSEAKILGASDRGSA